MKDQLITGVNVIENQVLIAKEHLQSKKFLDCWDSINKALFELQSLRSVIEKKLSDNPNACHKIDPLKPITPKYPI